MIVVNLDVMLAKRKMSMTELSQRVGITMANLSILKNGKSKAIRMSTLDAVCAALQCQPGDLLEWVPSAEQAVETAVPEEVPREKSAAKTPAAASAPARAAASAKPAHPAKADAPAKATASAKAPTKPAPKRKPKPEPVYRTVVTRLTLRDKGSRTAAVVGRLNNGTRVELLETEGQWAHIRAEGKDGWVLVNYLQ